MTKWPWGSGEDDELSSQHPPSPHGRSRTHPLCRQTLCAVWDARESGEVTGNLSRFRTDHSDNGPRRKALANVLRYLGEIEFDNWRNDAAPRVVGGALESDDA